MIGTSTGEVFEDSVDHILNTPNQRVSDSFDQLNSEKPVIKTPDSTKWSDLGPEIAGAKSAQYVGWLSSMFMDPATRAAGGAVATAITVPLMHYMKNGIIDDVKAQVASGTPIDKVKFEKGSAGDAFGLFSYLEGKFGKPIHEIKPEDKPLYASPIDFDNKRGKLEVPGPGGGATFQKHRDRADEFTNRNNLPSISDEQLVKNVQTRIRSIEYDRKLSGEKIDGKYPPNGELYRLRKEFKEMQEYLKSIEDKPLPVTGNEPEELKGADAIVGILKKHLQQGGKIPQLDYDSMPLSTNIEDRRNEDPIGNLIRSLPERDQWGKGGLRVTDIEDKLKRGKPLMEIPSGAGGSYPRITSPDINKTPANMNKPSGQISTTPTEEAALNRSWDKLMGKIGQQERGFPSVSPAGEFSHEPKHLGDAVTAWARGELKAKDVQQVFKKNGWTVDLRRGRYDVEAFDPSGKQHYIQP